VLICEHLNSETDRGWTRPAHSTTGVVSYCQASVQAVRCDGKLLPSVVNHIRSGASALLCRIAHCLKKCVSSPRWSAELLHESVQKDGLRRLQRQLAGEPGTTHLPSPRV